MKALVTGATGFIGYHVARVLQEKGIEVAALVRQTADVSDLQRIGVRLCYGDVRDVSSIVKALNGCTQVYHVAADYRLFVPDPKTMYDINVEGTKNVLQAALEAKVQKVVHTSSVGALATSFDGTPVSENFPVGLEDMVGHYKRSKYLAEREAEAFFQKGLPVVIVNPSTPVGEMDKKPTPTGQMIVDFLNKKMPAYLDTGLNFAYVKDVAEGHFLASTRGRTGEKYILGNKNLTLREFFQCLADIKGYAPPRVKLPYLPVLMAAYINEAAAKLFHFTPKIPVSGVKMAKKYMFFDCSKAVNVLNLPQTPVEKALELAVAWFEKKGYIKRLKSK